jgi:hypothetical protein
MDKKDQIYTLIKRTGLLYTIDNFKNILNVILDNVFNTPKLDSYINKRIRTCPGTISSIDTLRGIEELCVIRDYVDSYLLIRKLRDNLFLDLFLFESQKTFEKYPDYGFDDINLNDAEEVFEALNKFNLRCVDIETCNDELKAINNWKSNKLLMSNKNKDKDNYFKFSKYLEYLTKNNKDFGLCYNNFLKKRFDNLSLKLNDYTHSNSESTLNNNKNQVSTFTDIKATLKELEHLFLVSLFFVDSTLFASEDYVDCMECGIAPQEGSQYWVNGFILEAFVDIKLESEELFSFLLEHNNNFMEIDV